MTLKEALRLAIRKWGRISCWVKLNGHKMPGNKGCSLCDLKHERGTTCDECVGQPICLSLYQIAAVAFKEGKLNKFRNTAKEIQLAFKKIYNEVKDV